MITTFFCLTWAIMVSLLNDMYGSVHHRKLGLPFKKNKFNIRFVPIWWSSSNEFIYVEYTNNNGLTWHRIVTSERDYSTSMGDYKKEVSKTWRIYDGLKQELQGQFSDVEKCFGHNYTVRHYIKQQNKNEAQRVNKRKEEIHKFFKQ